MSLTLHSLEGIVGAGSLRSPEELPGYAVEGRAASVVVFPGSVEEVAEVLRLASVERYAVIPRGGGTAMGLGGIPERADLVLCLTRLRQVCDYEPADLTATVQAGITLADLGKVLGEKGQFLPLDVPRPAEATVGGTLAANVSGLRRLRYGAARDLLIGVRVVHANGAVTKGGGKVVKNVTGYDMNKLYIGSLGTLGVIVEATFRLYPLPAVEETWWAEFPTPAAAAAAASHLRDTPLTPSALLCLSPALTKSLRRGGGGGWTLVTAVGSVREAVQSQILRVGRVCDECGAGRGERISGDDHRSLWAALREWAGPGEGVLLTATVLLAETLSVCQAAEEVAASERVQCENLADAGSGIVRVRLRGERPEALAGAVLRLREKVEAQGGHLVVWQAPSLLKERIDVWGRIPPGAFALMQRLKVQFDPDRLLNPGRFVGRL